MTDELRPERVELPPGAAEELDPLVRARDAAEARVSLYVRAMLRGMLIDPARLLGLDTETGGIDLMPIVPDPVTVPSEESEERPRRRRRARPKAATGTGPDGD